MNRMILMVWMVVVAGDRARAVPQEIPRLISKSVEAAPEIDGRGDDKAWSNSTALTVGAIRFQAPKEVHATPVELRSVHTGTHLYLLARWRDETQDDGAHKPWVWDPARKIYAEGPEREDMFSVAFEHTGSFDGDMLSGTEAVWDVWQWKAVRTNPQGFAMDRSHRYTFGKPEAKASSYPSKSGKPIWISRPEDSGDTVEKKQPAPKEHQGERVPQYLPGSPTASAADVRAKGIWMNGWWTLEFERRLATGHPDDTAFDLRRSFRFAVAAHDRTGDMDKSSGVLELFFN